MRLRTGHLIEVRREVREAVDAGCSGDAIGVLGSQHQRLLPTHAGPDRIDVTAGDAHPGQGMLHDRGHARQVRDLARGGAGVVGEPLAFAGGADHGEIVAGRQTAPARGDGGGTLAPAVRRDHKRQAGSAASRVPRGQKEHGGSRTPIPGCVLDQVAAGRQDKPALTDSRRDEPRTEQRHNGDDAGQHDDQPEDASHVRSPQVTALARRLLCRAIRRPSAPPVPRLRDLNNS